MGFDRTVRTTIARPVEAVFDYISDIGRHGEWAGDKLTIRAGGGGSYQSVVEIGVKVAATIRVEASDRPRQFSYVCDDTLSGLYRWTFGLEPVPAGTVLSHRVERLRGPLLVRMIQPWLMWPLLGRPHTRRGLANIKELLENGTAGAADTPMRVRSSEAQARHPSQ
jgi:hypothetical protein